MSLQSPWISLVALALMLLAALGGTLIRRRWPEHHTNRETIELLQTTVMLLATFAAIVLGLLLTSAKADFDTLQNDIRSFAATLVQLDYALEELGPSAVPIRHRLVRYAAASTADVWRGEPAPAGNFYPRLPPSNARGMGANTALLGQLLERADTGLQTFTPASAEQSRQQAAAQRLMNIAVSQRWQIIEASMGTLSAPFFTVLVFWIVVIFLCFGLSAPLNYVNAMTQVLSAMALGSALFVIIDLYTPYDGIFTVSSQPMRLAVHEMLSQPDGTPPPFARDCSRLSPDC